MKLYLRVLASMICYLCISVVPTFASVQNVYVAQSTSGAANGTSCANAYGIAFFNGSANWGGGSAQIGPGTVVHLCGTITGNLGSNLLTFQGSGVSGNPITLLWEPGAVLTSPACGNSVNACINVNGSSFVTLDGNGTSPSITNTANGSTLTYQIDAKAIWATPCNNCIFRNLTITNIFQHNLSTDTTNGIGTGIDINGSNDEISHNLFDQMFVGVNDSYQNGDTQLQIHHNTLNHTNWGIHVGGNAPTALSHVFIHDNHILNLNNWDDPIDAFHHDGIFVVQDNTSAAITDVEIYNNLADGDPGAHTTAWIFVNTGMNGMYIFNNVLRNPFGGSLYLMEGGYAGDRNYYIVDNFFDCNTVGALNFGPVENITIENNVMRNCYSYISTHNITGTVNVNTNAYDLAGSGTGNAFQWNGNVGSTYTAYRAANPTLDVKSITPADLMVDSAFIPQIGSPLIGAGTNLSNLGITALDYDRAGSLRPGGLGAWDLGSYQSGSSSALPAPPTALAARVL